MANLTISRTSCSLRPTDWERYHPIHALPAARFEYAFKQLPRSQKLLLLESPEQWQTVLPELAEETYLPAEHLPLQSYLSRS